MPCINRDDLPLLTAGPYTSRTVDWHGKTLMYEVITDDLDAAPFFANLPGGRCECAHWGYMLKGQTTMRYEDHDETFTEGQFFYTKPGHVPMHKKGTVFITFSDTEEHMKTRQGLDLDAKV